MKDFFQKCTAAFYVSQTQKYAIYTSTYSMVQKVQKCSKLQLFLERLLRKYIEQKQKLVLLNFKWFQTCHFRFQFESTGILPILKKVSLTLYRKTF